MNNLRLEIIYESQDYVAINKPHGLLVHRTNLDKHANEFALQTLRDQLNQKIHPCHRLDRKTSGALLFAKNKKALTFVRKQFDSSEIEKKYLAIVRGFVEDEITIDYPLTENSKTQDAISFCKCLKQYEIPLKHGKHNTSRYSLVALKPKTGRFHQLRKHMAHIFHPILGDRPHGCNKQNKLWKENFQLEKMMLHASELIFHNQDQETIKISAKTSSEFQRILSILETQSLI